MKRGELRSGFVSSLHHSQFTIHYFLGTLPARRKSRIERHAAVDENRLSGDVIGLV